MKTYAVSRYLTDEQKCRILAAEYKAGRCRTADGCCPLEVALELRPSHSQSRVLLALKVDAAGRIAAREFMFDVDRGTILPTDLPTAIGALTDEEIKG